MSQVTKKVAGVQAPKAPKEKAPKKTRTDYVGTGKTTTLDGKEVSLVNEKGQLVAAPTDYDFKAHKPLSKKNFADDAAFIDFRAMAFEYRAERFKLQASSLRERAVKIREFGDPAARKKALRVDRLKKQLAELEKELAASK